MRVTNRAVLSRGAALAATTLAIGALVAIAQVGGRADRAGDVGDVLDELRADAYARSSAEWQAIATSRIGAGELDEIDELDRMIVERLDTLAELADPAMVADIRAAYLAYDAGVRDEFAFLRAGDVDAAAQVDRDVVDPKFEMLEERVVEARQMAQERERASRIRASRAGVLIGTAAIALGWLLIGMFVRLRRRDTIDQLERARLAHEVESAQALAALRAREANHDALTALPNRRFVMEQLSAGASDWPTEDAGRSVLLVDLDAFKLINDTLGHGIGDDVLVIVAERFAAVVGDHGFLARLGGDEFAVIVSEPLAQRLDRALALAVALHGVLEQPVIIDGLALPVVASIGIASAPFGGAPGEALRHADVAMYQAKRSGSGTSVYVADDDAHSRSGLALASELDRAFERDEIVPYYQPQVEIASGSVVAAEALARWHHPVFGVIGPDRLLPVVVQRGMVRRLTDHMLDRAIAQVAEWHRGGRLLAVSVNVTNVDLNDPRLVGEVEKLLVRHDVGAAFLKLEVVEDQLVSLTEHATTNLRRLGELGVALSLDDYGSGYSSLGQLRALPVREIKIDRGFVRHLDSERFDQAVVASTIAFARSLGLSVVAEGVETDAVLDDLAALRADVAQGYLFARPLPAAAFMEWIAGHEASTARDRTVRAPSAVGASSPG